MTDVRPGARLRSLIARPEGVVTSACWDCMTARLLESAGFEALFVSGAAVSGSRLGLPDFGFLGLTDMADAVRRIAASVDVPVLVDADTGHGNLLNAVHTAHTLADAGAAGILLEDQVFPKRCGHLVGVGKAVVPVEEQLPKLRALAAERPNPDFLIVGRTDSLSIEGVERAIERVNRYLEAGADIAFVEAPTTLEQLELIGREVDAPLMYNLSTGGLGPRVTVEQLRELGFDWVDISGVAMAAVTHGVRALGEAALRAGSDEPLASTGFSPAALAELYDSPGWLDLQARHA